MHQMQRYLPSQPRRNLPAGLLTATGQPFTPDVPGTYLAQNPRRHPGAPPHRDHSAAASDSA
jgi:hypothetical protein